MPLWRPLPGLKVIAQKFPEGLVTGSIPTSCLSSPTSSAKRSSGPQPPSQPAERRWRFTADELCRIQEQLEEVQIPSNASSKSTVPGSRSSGSSLETRAGCGGVKQLLWTELLYNIVKNGFQNHQSIHFFRKHRKTQNKDLS